MWDAHRDPVIPSSRAHSHTWGTGLAKGGNFDSTLPPSPHRPAQDNELLPGLQQPGVGAVSWCCSGSGRCPLQNIWGLFPSPWPHQSLPNCVSEAAQTLRALPGRLEISVNGFSGGGFQKSTQLSGGRGGARLLPAQRSHGSAWGNGRTTEP